MGNCLFTKLKGSVANEQLEKLGVLTIVASEETIGETPSPQMKIYLSANKPISLKAIGGYISKTVGGLSDLTDEVVFESAPTQQAVYFSNGNYKVEINDKYAVTAITYGGSYRTIPKLDFSKFGYLTSLTQIYQGTNDTSFGNIDGLCTSINLEDFRAPSTEVTGSLDSFIPCTKLTIIQIARTHITGSLRVFAAGQVAAGRTTGEIAFRSSNYISLDGNYLSSGTNKVITFNSSLPDGYSISDPA